MISKALELILIVCLIFSHWSLMNQEQSLSDQLEQTRQAMAEVKTPKADPVPVAPVQLVMTSLRDDMPVSIRWGDFGDGHPPSEGNDPRLIPAGVCIGGCGIVNVLD